MAAAFALQSGFSGSCDGRCQVHLGTGKTLPDGLAVEQGFNATVSRTSKRWISRRVFLQKTDALRWPLCRNTHVMNGRELVRAATWKNSNRIQTSLNRTRNPGKLHFIPSASTYKGGHAWGMVDRYSAPVSDATRAWSPARRRTTFRLSAKNRSRLRPRDALDSRRSLFRRQRDESGNLSSAGAVHALRERAVRTGLPGRGDRAQRRRPERDGLQPLRRHALLLEQLPVQGAAIQFFRISTIENPTPTAAAMQSRT